MRYCWRIRILSEFEIYHPKFQILSHHKGAKSTKFPVVNRSQIVRNLRRWGHPLGLTVGSLLLTHCGGGMQSSLHAAGPQAGRIGHLWWFLFAVCLGVYVLVVGFLLAAMGRARRRDSIAVGAERRMTKVVGSAVALTVIILFAFLIASVAIGRAVSSLPTSEAMAIQLIGHQWWWEVHYPNAVASQTVITANEMHIPAGRPVILQVTSQDVIHSFWAPNLHGKIDLIPGHVNTIWFQADQPGIFRGQCAEFCGFQHAHMAFFVVAEPPEQLAAWLEQQRRPAAEPGDPVLQRGREVFLSSPCILCHTIRGTGAFGQAAPDLTHLASRRSIAAGTLPNTRGHLAGWIADSRTIKPGNRMPPMSFKPDDLQALLVYLESLK